MVRSESLPFESYAKATRGQLTWVWLNYAIDYDERLKKIHPHCQAKFLRDLCEICGEPIKVFAELPEEIQEQIYRPEGDELETQEFKR